MRKRIGPFLQSSVKNRRIAIRLFVIAVGLSLFAFSAGVLAQELPGLIPQEADSGKKAAEKKEKVDPTQKEVEVLYPNDNPRAAVSAFRSLVEEGRYDEAIGYFDENHPLVKKEDDGAAAKQRARALYQIFTYLPEADLKQLSDKPDGSPVSILTGYQTDPIRLFDSPDGRWRFTAGTIDQAPQILKGLRKIEAVKRGKFLHDLFPAFLVKNRFLYLPYYQWISIFAFLVLGFLVNRLVRLVLNWLTFLWLKSRRIELDSHREHRLWRPIGLLVGVLVWYWGLRLVGLPPRLMDLMLYAIQFFAVFAGVWTAFLIVDLVIDFWRRTAERTATRFDNLMVPWIGRFLKVLLIITGVLAYATAAGRDLTGLLGGLGIGGIAVAFAAKDAVANVFGSITVLMDRPFEIGDWIKTEQVEGSVETVGMRSTRVRTFYGSLVTLPNSQLTTATVDNMGKRRYRRFKTKISLEYQTPPERIIAFVEGVRELVRRHPYTRKDLFHVYLNELGDSALQVLLYCFFECPTWSIELRERERLLLDILRLGHELEVSFAFPTQTVHVWQRGTDPPVPTSEMEEGSNRFGRRNAAEIAGPFLSAEQRPGPVEFIPPFDPDAPEEKGCQGK